MSIYRALKLKIKISNRICSKLLLAYYAVVMGYYCEAPDLFREYYIKASLLSTVIYLYFNIFACIFAADFHSSVQQSFLQWHDNTLFHSIQHRTEFNSNFVMPQHTENYMKLMEVKNEMHIEPIALSCKFFAVTNQFLSSVRVVCKLLNTIKFTEY